jgi:predicted transcriptional regulator
MASRRKPHPPETVLSRRERQIMDILFTLKSASGQQVQERLDGAPSYSTVRTILRVLERKGFVAHTEKDLRYIYRPTVALETAQRSALERIVHTFFDGSAKQAIAAFLDPSTYKLTRSDLDELSEMIRRAKKETR